MAEFTKAELVDLFPEFADDAEARILAWQDMAKYFVSVSVFGDRYKSALMLYTAHLLTMSGQARQGGVGQVLSERVGDVSRTFAESSSTGTALKQTTYGQQFLSLARATLGVVGGFAGVSYDPSLIDQAGPGDR